MHCLAETIGKSAYQDIYQDGVNITKEYKDMQTLKMIKPLLWLKQRNALLLSFLNGATSDNSSDKKNYVFTHIVEQICYTLNLNIITPFSFHQNLVMYTLQLHYSYITVKYLLKKCWKLHITLRYSSGAGTTSNVPIKKQCIKYNW